MYRASQVALVAKKAKVKMEVKFAQSCLTLCDPMDHTVHGILQARILEWVAFPFSRGIFPTQGSNPGQSIIIRTFFSNEEPAFRAEVICTRLHWVRKMPWRKARQPTPVFLPEESHGQRSLVGYSPWGLKASDTTEVI